MKNIIFFFSLLFTSTLLAQTENRVLIEGKVNVRVDEDAEGINVYNINTMEGTVTNEYGEFMIPVKANDKLMFTAIQYQEFTVLIDENVVKNKRLSITIHEAVTELEEVTVKPYNLSGDVIADVNKIEVKDVNLVEQSSSEMVNTYGYEFRSDRFSSVENDAIDKGYLKNGLNFANIFREIFKGSSDKKEMEHREDIDVTIRKMYNDDFFRKNLDIEKEHINEFIYYAEEDGLTTDMLSRGNELELIQFLIQKSEEFKMQQRP